MYNAYTMDALEPSNFVFNTIKYLSNKCALTTHTVSSQCPHIVYKKVRDHVQDDMRAHEKLIQRAYGAQYNFNIIRIKLNMLKSLLNCMKFKCKTNSWGCHHHLYPYSMMTVSTRMGLCLYRQVTLSIMYR